MVQLSWVTEIRYKNYNIGKVQCHAKCNVSGSVTPPVSSYGLAKGGQPTKVEGKSQSEGKALPLAHSGPMSMGKTEGGQVTLGY